MAWQNSVVMGGNGGVSGGAGDGGGNGGQSQGTEYTLQGTKDGACYWHMWPILT